jgi:hypothetical protein
MELSNLRANLSFANGLFHMTAPIKIEVKNKLYFNKFEYKAVCTIRGASYTYYTTDIQTFVARMEKLRDVSRNKYGVRVIDEHWREYWDEVSIDQISQFLTWRDTVKKEKCMIRIQGDTVSFFSNELNLLETLVSIDHKLSFYQVKVLASDTLYFTKTPKHKHRTFFKGKRCSEDFLKNVIEFAQRYPASKVSGGLLNFASRRRNSYTNFMYMHGSYYVDYDDPSMLSILHMLFPGMIAKTYSLEKRP